MVDYDKILRMQHQMRRDLAKTDPEAAAAISFKSEYEREKLASKRLPADLEEEPDGTSEGS